jgi:hydrogenase-4 component E
MNTSTFAQLLNLVGGGFLLTGVLMLWRRELSAIVRLLTAQGVLLAALAALLGAREGDSQLYLIAAGLFALKAVALPAVLRRVLRQSGEAREAAPLVNVAASMLAAVLLIFLGYAVSRPLAALAPSPTTTALPVGLAAVLLGFFALVSRRRALSQVAGFLLLDNGITATALLATSGVPLIVELSASLDLLLVILVLQILAGRLRIAFGHADLDELRELHD